MPTLEKLGPVFHPLGQTTIRILMVVDGNIDTVEGPGAFGIGRVVRLINQLRRGCTRFEVHTARRQPHIDAAENAGHISTSFRFDAGPPDARVIDRYDQIWLFGIRGEGHPLTVDNAELRVLVPWMNRGGGLFATGDHEDLGAALCGPIPRVREMRRWTAADGVPPAGGHTRLDTNRPTSPAEANGSVAMTFAHERDAVPQRIEWTPVWQMRQGLRLLQRPHEILCHPSLGPIDVMPDHPHEGRTRELAEMNLARTYNLGGGVSGSDFPSAGGTQPQPVVIARGETFAAPPSSKPYKPPSAGHFEFPMITVYDGRAAGVQGRVAVDSTWHHWFDLNLVGLEAAADKTAWHKVSRYFENLAVWLAPPGRLRLRCWVIGEFFRYPLLEELGGRELTLKTLPDGIGALLRDRFIAVFGPCTTTQFVWDNLCALAPRLCKGLERFDPTRLPPRLPPQCLSCPPWPLLEEAVFEGLARGAIPFLEAHAAKAEALLQLDEASLDKALAKHLAPALEQSVTAFGQAVVKDLQAELKAWQAVAGRPPR